GADQPHRPVVERLGNVGALLSDLLQRQGDVLLGDFRHAGVVLGIATPGRLHGGTDLAEQAGQAAQLDAVDGAFAGAAGGVPEDDDQLHAHVDGVLQAPYLVVVHDVPGHAHGEHVADALIEQDLDRRARVHATEYGGERVLSGGGREHLGGPVAPF